MIALLEGKLASKNVGRVIISAGGVGFEVSCTTQALESVGEVGNNCILHIDTQVREDAIVLYGFSTAEERDLFRRLISVHGIGAATGLAILSTYSPHEVINYILANNTKAICKVPGIGPKGAQRLCLELKDRLGDLLFPETDQQATITMPVPQTLNSVFEDVQAGLINLGYKQGEVSKVIDKLQEVYPTENDLAKLLKLALRQLTK